MGEGKRKGKLERQIDKRRDTVRETNGCLKSEDDSE